MNFWIFRTSNLKTVSSVYWEIRFSFLFILMPLMFLLFLIFIERNSGQIRNRWKYWVAIDDIRVQVWKKDRHPACVTADNVLFWETDIHFLIGGPKLKKWECFLYEFQWNSVKYFFKLLLQQNPFYIMHLVKD